MAMTMTWKMVVAGMKESTRSTHQREAVELIDTQPSSARLASRLQQDPKSTDKLGAHGKLSGMCLGGDGFGSHDGR